MNRAGCVYILSNPAFAPDLLKIGMTRRRAHDRAWELYLATGVPSKFVVELEEPVSDCQRAEALIHDQLRAYRPNGYREFFRLPLQDAIRIVRSICEDVECHPDYSTRLRMEAEARLAILGEDVGAADAAVGRAPYGFYTQRVLLTCQICRSSFSVTLTRYEMATFCPTCDVWVDAPVQW